MGGGSVLSPDSVPASIGYDKKLGQMRMPGNPDHIDVPDSQAKYRRVQICIEQRLEL